MNRNVTDIVTPTNATAVQTLRFFTESIEVEKMSPLAFFEAGKQLYDQQRFYWQNADQTVTIVGVGHAYTLSNEKQVDRYADISKKWDQLCRQMTKKENDRDPILFGGFSFDPNNHKQSEWNRFPSSFFVVPTFQLVVEKDLATVSINLISHEHSHTIKWEQLRKQRDQLIASAQRNAVLAEKRPQFVRQIEHEKEQYLQAVQRVTEKIRLGEAEKVVIARLLELQFSEAVSKATALQMITSGQQASYCFGLEKNNQMFFGATPERLVQITDGYAYSVCVAGSIRRGKTVEEDDRLGEMLLNDKKNLQEHQYVVEMISSIFRSHCSTIDLPTHPQLLKLRDIQHLYTPVKGSVAKGQDIFQFVEALHPTPALGGTPTDVAMRLIREEEELDRGYYAAPIGWTDASGNGEFAVAIRSALLDAHRAYLFAGGGIVADSNPVTEYEETWIKFRPILRALGGKLHE